MHALDDPRLQDHIKLLWDCRNTCQETLFNHCLEKGGVHIEPAHLRSLWDCIQICQMTADLLTRRSPSHQVVCRACAEICDACAVSCESIKDKKMLHCADLCRRCAKACHDMANPVGEAAA